MKQFFTLMLFVASFFFSQKIVGQNMSAQYAAFDEFQDAANELKSSTPDGEAKLKAAYARVKSALSDTRSNPQFTNYVSLRCEFMYYFGLDKFGKHAEALQGLEAMSGRVNGLNLSDFPIKFVRDRKSVV